MGTRRIGLLLCVAVLLAAVPGLARDAYFQVAVKDLQVTEGALPEAGTTLSLSWRQFEAMYPEALVDGDGEAYLMGEFRYWNWPFDFNDQAVLHVRAPAGKAVTGALLIPRTDREHPGMDRVVFRLEAKQASAAAREAFQAAKVAWYERLLHRGVPGAAWFRHQRDEALADARRGVPDEALTAEQRRSRQVDDLADTYDLFTGSRALGENLQLDRVLLPRKGNGSLVELSTIEGITVKEYDWSARLAADKPQLDPLARTVPGDQHALFFPTFSALIQLSDEADGLGTPLLTLFEARSEDAGVKHRYQEQLCLSMSALSRLLGPSVVASVAFTGSDPFLRMGSDVAVLFEAKNPELLMEHIRGKQKAAREAAGLSPVTGRLGAWEYEGVCSQSRHICSYVARHGTLVVVTNSPAQLGRIEATAQGSVPSLGDSQEYLFFRQRYLRGDSRETALLILPDAAIRRWCGPQWRIADSRRIRAAALLSQLHADHVGKVVAGETGTLPVDPRLSGLGALALTGEGVHSEVYGTLGFMTPIVEMEMDRVTQEEADAYGWFRDRYQRNWRDYFDPIAIRFTLNKEEVGLDISVMPLIAGSEYRELIELTRGMEMKATAGDPHPEALFRFGISLNPDSPPVRQVSGFALSMAPGFQGNTLSWLGDHVVVYGDMDSYWTDLVRAPKKNDFLEHNFHRLPVAVRVAISSPMKATAFLASVRAFIEQTAPNMTLWETKKHRGLSYVKISPAQQWDDDLPEELAFYYAVSGGGLTMTLNEGVLKAALARDAKRAKSADAAARVDRKGEAWQGGQVGFQADGDVLELLELGARDELLPEMQSRSWGNLPILNEWKRLFPEEDPVAVHERLWQVRLQCPGGGKYVWNEAWHTMESTVYGHPAVPKAGSTLLRPPLSEFTFGNFGLTFEDDGLRAKATLLRRARHQASLVWRALRRWCGKMPASLCNWGRLVYGMSTRLGSHAAGIVLP